MVGRISSAIDPDDGLLVARDSLLARFLMGELESTERTNNSRYLTGLSKTWRGGLRFARPMKGTDARTPFAGQARLHFAT
jgi:hypothetical protein